MKVQDPPLRQEMSHGVLVGCSSCARMVEVSMSMDRREFSDCEEALLAMVS